MDLHLNDKVIIVTSGANGVGEHISRALADEGAVAFIVGRNEIENNHVVKQITAAGGRAESFIAELTTTDACKAAVEAAVSRFCHIDGIVNNSCDVDGIDFKQTTPGNFLENLHHNIVPYFMMTQAALPALIQSKGSIVNIAFQTIKTDGEKNSGHNISNGAHNALTREWAVDLLKYNIRVNAVSVPAVLNQLSITNEEIANTVAFLLSEKSSHTTGQIIHL